ncbi:AraC family transcriptional regulator ligand-binding domain-containing protein [uncultured Oceanicoccus sp.]|uniref:AraC family transcriptional regulator n=1 Tax=uncultured Oceanicoccus sp. TaxID=1706381 RepID=UPI0030DAB991
MQEQTLQRSIYKHLIFQLNQAGISEQQLFDRFALGTSEMSLVNHKVFAGTEALTQLETAVKLAGDKSLTFRLGQKVDIANYGAFGFALMSCANLREAITLLVRYGKAFFQTNWKSYETDSGLLLRINLNTGTAEQQQFMLEMIFSQLSFLSTTLYGGQVEGSELHLTYPAPTYQAYYQKLISVPVSFNQKYNQLYFPAKVLDIPIRTANPSDHVVFQQQCEEMLRDLSSVGKITSKVRRLLILSAGEFLDISQVSKRLCVSERTLRRRLKDESTSFRAILDEIRNLLACKYLTKTSLTVTEIAHLLDFSEAIHFRRAFVRWNAITPAEYRQKQNP